MTDIVIPVVRVEYGPIPVNTWAGALYNHNVENDWADVPVAFIKHELQKLHITPDADDQETALKRAFKFVTGISSDHILFYTFDEIHDSNSGDLLNDDYVNWDNLTYHDLLVIFSHFAKNNPEKLADNPVVYVDGEFRPIQRFNIMHKDHDEAGVLDDGHLFLEANC
jgi:hypothetical protein